MSLPMDPEIARSLLDVESPFHPHAVDSPRVAYGGGGSPWLAYPHRDEERFVRASFDRFDALRISRGEYPPYELDENASAVCVVERSRWLQERFEYEDTHYGATGQYAGGDVSEMQEEFEHYLFLFHDEFVEVIAGGVSFETRDAPLEDDTPLTRVGLDDLPEATTIERRTEEGIVFQLRRDPRSPVQILEASRFCDQSLYQLALELDGRVHMSRRLTVRTQRGATKSRWRSQLGCVEATFSGIPELTDLRPLIAEYAGEVVAARRREKGDR